ncbi:MAG TPA: ATP-binding cassette domain-containing protein [Dehalococcoidia bacterium]|nr:ATP-binding cassette domain-containing protein [Dehalococcoidia bacterium]
MAAIEVEALEKRFRARRKQPGLGGSLRALFAPQYSEICAVDRVSFTIARGEIAGFIGPNGAGKSTTLKMLTGILHPSGGSARVLGLVPWRERKRLTYRIASVFGQRSQLWYHLPPADSFNLLAHVYELEPAAFRARQARLVELFGIAPYLHVPVRRLSLGERMRCEIAAALLHRPEVLLLDEPTIGLDVVAKGQIRALVRQLADEEQVTVLLTSHDAGDIEQVCRRVLVINHGTLIFDDTLERLRRGYLRHKVIDLKLAEPGEPAPEPGLRVLAADPYRLRLEVDTDAQSMERVIAALVGRYRIADLTVEEPPLDEVIAAIYAAGRPPEQHGVLATPSR